MSETKKLSGMSPLVDSLAVLSAEVISFPADFFYTTSAANFQCKMHGTYAPEIAKLATEMGYKVTEISTNGFVHLERKFEDINVVANIVLT